MTFEISYNAIKNNRTLASFLKKLPEPDSKNAPEIELGPED